MARRRSSSQDPLCCCEYFDRSGERNHIVFCCCNCEALDTMCDRCITGKDVSPEMSANLLSTIEDRCRIPWLHGAVRIKLDVALPVVAIPGGILLASVSLVWTIIVTIVLPLFLLLFHRAWMRHPGNRRTRVFYIWGLTSLIVTYYIFALAIGFREILLWEALLESTLFVLTLYTLYHARKSPGVLKRSVLIERQQLLLWRRQWKLQTLTSDVTNGGLMGDSESKLEESSQNTSPEQMMPLPGPVSTDEDSQHSTWCQTCCLQKLPRSGHCPVCNICVQGRDHHCLWIDNCVGASNHRAFFLCLLLIIVSGCYGSHLTLTTICTPDMYFDWFLWPTDCRFMYDDSVTAICFVGVCYTVACTTAMCILLLQQIVLISQNITSYELHLAHQNRQTSCLMWARNHPDNRGLYRNWFDFLTGRRKRQTLGLVNDITV